MIKSMITGPVRMQGCIKLLDFSLSSIGYVLRVVGHWR